MNSFQVFLPHGAYVKVMTSEQLINVWVVPSPNDLYMTEGDLNVIRLFYVFIQKFMETLFL